MWMAWLRVRFPRRESRQTLRPSGRHLDGGGAVEGAEAVACREAGDVAGDADDRGGHDRAHSEDVDDGGAGRRDDLLEPLRGLGELAVDAAEILEELAGKLDPSSGDGAVGLNASEQRSGFTCIDLVGNAASDEVAQHGVESADHLSAADRQVPMPPRPQLHHRGVILDTHLLRRR
jgi:hypothetical protein